MDLLEFEKQMRDDLTKKFGLEEKYVWVWEKNPKVDGVLAFYGDGVVNNAVVIWITERPSLARYKRKEHKFPDRIDDIFYGLLKEEGFENIHFTDFCKVMAKSGKRPSDEELKASAKWLKKEIEMLDKRVEGKKLIIVANSHKVEDWIEKYLPKYKGNVTYKHFFKWYFRFKSQNARELIRNDLKQVYEETKNA